MHMTVEAPPHPLVRSYLFLRRGVGLLGMSLPFVLILGNLLIGGGLLHSISGYYHSELRDVYVGAMCAVGVFLLFYRGYSQRETVASIVAGVSAIGAALFPMKPPVRVTDAAQLQWVGWLHIAFAAVLFLTFAYFCLVEFPKTGGVQPTSRGRKRNALYRLCGWIILLSLALIALSGFVPDADVLRPALWLESLATVAFGLAWLTKGHAILGDLD